MKAPSPFPVAPSSLLLLLLSPGMLRAQSTLPATAPTQPARQVMTAPLSATGNAGENGAATSHPGRVTCTGGQLEIHAQNSSLSGILRSVSRCTGMVISGTIPEQRVFGDYGPAAPATVLATLLDGTGSNMLLKETASDQPAMLLLTPRTGGATPPQPASPSGDESNNGNATQDDDDSGQGGSQMPPSSVAGNPYRQPGQRGAGSPGMAPTGNTQQPAGGNPNQTPVPSPMTGSAVTSPQPIPIGNNNVNGNPNNRSPTASTYPTTNSVPLDSIATPSTTPSSNGIVDAPNPPAAGSDTAALLNGAPKGTPGTTNISPDNTTQTSTPGATNTTVPATGQPTPQTDLTPEQIFQQLQQRQQQQQEQQQQTGPQ